MPNLFGHSFVMFSLIRTFAAVYQPKRKNEKTDGKPPAGADSTDCTGTDG
jgi:hypothetical protein